MEEESFELVVVEFVIATDEKGCALSSKMYPFEDRNVMGYSIVDDATGFQLGCGLVHCMVEVLVLKT